MNPDADSQGLDLQQPKPSRARRWLRRFFYLFAIAVCLAVALWALVTQPLLGPVARVESKEVSAQRLLYHVQRIVAIQPRDFDHPEVLDRVAAYVRGELTSAGARVSDQPFPVSGRTYRNVCAEFGPATGERIVVGAHYDVNRGTPGADDNASGVAGLIELAHALGRRAPPLCVELVAFSLEEPPNFGTPHMGSAVHARRLKEKGVSVRAMLCLEMIGYYSDEPGSQRLLVPGMELCYPSQGNFIGVIGRFQDGRVTRQVKRAMRGVDRIGVHSINGPPSLVPQLAFSDHRNYWHEGYSAVMITDTSFFRTPHYHQPSDTPETLDYDRMAAVVQGVLAAIEVLSEAVP